MILTWIAALKNTVINNLENVERLQAIFVEIAKLILIVVVAGMFVHTGVWKDFCGVACDTDSDCPSGFGCYDWTLDDGGLTRQCLTYCWLYIDERPVPPENIRTGNTDANLSKDDVMLDFIFLNEPTCTY